MKILIALCATLSIFIVYTFYTTPYFQTCPQRLLEIHYLNIGQGDAIYIRTPSGADVLIDTGPGNVVNKALGQTFHFINNSLDIVFVTHFDMDHSGGLAVLLRNFDVQYFVTASVYEKDDALLQEIIEVHKNTDGKNESFLHTTVSAGDRIVIDENNSIYFEVLYPDASDKTEIVNNQSLVMRLVYGNTRFLFMGDAEQSVERIILQKYPNSLQANIIKLGHHGSRTSSAPEFIEKVSPEFAIISAGLDNSYGHPHQETLDTLDSVIINDASINKSTSTGEGISPSPSPSSGVGAGDKIKVRETKTADQIFYSDGESVWEREGRNIKCEKIR